MKRIAPLLLLVVAAAALVFFGMSGGDSHGEFDARQLTIVERRIAAEDFAGARKALETDPAIGEAERLYGTAAVALKEGNLERALRDARASRKLAPSAWWPLSIEFSALASLGRFAEAGVLAREAAEAAPDDERVLAMAAHHFASVPKDPDPRYALELLDRIDALPERKAPEGDPTHVRPEQLLKVRYFAALATGRNQLALAVAEELEELAPADKLYPVLTGEAARRAGDNHKAIQAYQRAKAANPTELMLRKNLVQLLLTDPLRVEETLAESFALVRAAPNDRDAIILRARTLARAEKFVPTGPDEAVRIYRAVLQQTPDDLQVLRNLAVLLYDWKQGGQEGAYLDESYALLRRYKFRGGVIDESLADVWKQLTERAREQLSPEVVDAVGVAFRATPGDPGLAEAYYSALITRGEAREAGSAVRKAIAAAPDNAAIRLFAARHFLAEGPDQHPETAISEIDAAVKLLGGDERLPEAVLWLRVRGYIWAERNEEALDDALRLLAMRPRESVYLEAAGRAALGAGKYPQAEQFLREAISLAPREELEILLERAVKKQSK